MLIESEVYEERIRKAYLTWSLPAMVVPSSSACFSSTSDTFFSSSEPCCCMNTAPANPRPLATRERDPAESCRMQAAGDEALVRARHSEDGANA